MLELQHISWTAPGGSQVVRGVGFSVPEGKLTVITGPSGGAALFAAGQLTRRTEFQGKTVVVLLPDRGERYLSTGMFG